MTRVAAPPTEPALNPEPVPHSSLFCCIPFRQAFDLQLLAMKAQVFDKPASGRRLRGAGHRVWDACRVEAQGVGQGCSMNRT